ncbi:hypothetical protein EYF80_000111 [Liparis tanakae]|uniref:Uncharacterized protein n=1 Tax=Liparis tanakae TaxID=230148 RepID=A0A4Z2JIQ7_9TELE|nr:hypothetical protein EYF80_000111 [Liparis tanakae]
MSTAGPMSTLSLLKTMQATPNPRAMRMITMRMMRPEGDLVVVVMVGMVVVMVGMVVVMVGMVMVGMVVVMVGMVVVMVGMVVVITDEL